jgi:hypothetical protein
MQIPTTVYAVSGSAGDAAQVCMLLVLTVALVHAPVAKATHGEGVLGASHTHAWHFCVNCQALALGRGLTCAGVGPA